MAAKKNLLSGGPITYKDLFDTQDALDSGAQDSVTAGISYRGVGQNEFATDINANKDNFGSVLQGLNTNMSDALGAFKKRKADQLSAQKAGSGINQTVLGGGAY